MYISVNSVELLTAAFINLRIPTQIWLLVLAWPREQRRDLQYCPPSFPVSHDCWSWLRDGVKAEFKSEGGAGTGRGETCTGSHGWQASFLYTFLGYSLWPEEII